MRIRRRPGCSVGVPKAGGVRIRSSARRRSDGNRAFERRRAARSLTTGGACYVEFGAGRVDVAFLSGTETDWHVPGTVRPSSQRNAISVRPPRTLVRPLSLAPSHSAERTNSTARPCRRTRVSRGSSAYAGLISQKQPARPPSVYELKVTHLRGSVRRRRSVQMFPETAALDGRSGHDFTSSYAVAVVASGTSTHRIKETRSAYCVRCSGVCG